MNIWDMGEYAAYIWPSYGVSVVALVGMIVWTLRGWYAAKARLAALERK